MLSPPGSGPTLLERCAANMRTEKEKPDPLLRKLLTRLDGLRRGGGGTPR
jgi:hypothetical protein